MDDEEWGEWQIHDGKGCPVPAGTMVAVIFRDMSEFVGLALCNVHEVYRGQMPDDERWSRWWWASERNRIPNEKHIIQFRIKRPKGLTILESLIADLPAPANPKVDA